jgi:hypothetical protein
MIKKALDYLEAGSQAVLLLDAEPQRAILVTPPGQLQVLERDHTLDLGHVLPGFTCRVGEFFE